MGESQQQIRPQRSVMYVPGSKERALGKVPDMTCDAVILDLEDSVGPAEKEAARDRVCALVNEFPAGRLQVTVRVNSPGTTWHDADMAAVIAAGPDAVVVPKVDSAAQAMTLAQQVATANVALWPMIETPQAVVEVAQIASCHPAVQALVTGTNDLWKELRAKPTSSREGLWFSLGAIVVAARAAEISCFDGVFNDVRDDAGFVAEARQGVGMGFDGKTLIHPGQVPLCHEVFSPSPDEIADAEAVVKAWSTAGDGGVAVLNGRMIESLHVEMAQRTLALAQAAAAD